MKIAFSLLHYNNKEVTTEAIAYLQKISKIEECEIIVVDNASPNGSGEKLMKAYENISNIHVIINSKNGGFAYGNNIGYQFAKKLGCDVIVVMNNDIFIKDQDFITKLESESSICDGEIIAPNIIGRNGAQNPFRLEPLSDQKLKKMLWYNSFVNIIYHIPVIKECLAAFLDKKSNRKKQSVAVVTSGTKCIPHGACVIYLSNWIKYEEIAFVPDTFMYFEEDVLGEYMLKKKYSAVYNDELVVYHVEDASVEYDNKTSVKKRLFISECMKKSIKALIRIRNSKV